MGLVSELVERIITGQLMRCIGRRRSQADFFLKVIDTKPVTQWMMFPWHQDKT